MGEHKLQHDERIIKQYDIPSTESGSKLASAIPIVSTIILVALARYIPHTDFTAIMEILEDYNITGIYVYILGGIAIALIYFILMVMIPGLAKGATTLLRSSGLRYIFTNKKIMVKTAPKPVANPKPGQPMSRQYLKKQKKKNEPNDLYSIEYNEISDYEAELDYIRLHLKPSFKMLFSGIHLATILGFPLRLNTPKGKGPEIASILLTHRQYT